MKSIRAILEKLYMDSINDNEAFKKATKELGGMPGWSSNKIIDSALLALSELVRAEKKHCPTHEDDKAPMMSVCETCEVCFWQNEALDHISELILKENV